VIFDLDKVTTANGVVSSVLLLYHINMYKVDGRLIKEKIGNTGLFRYRLIDGTRYFDDLEKAFNYSNKVYNYTKIMLGVRKSHKSLTKKTKITIIKLSNTPTLESTIGKKLPLDHSGVFCYNYIRPEKRWYVRS